MEFDIEKILKISFTAMRINLSHPEIVKDLKWAIQMSLGLIIFTIPWLALFHNIFWINLRQNDFSETCKNSILFITYFAVTMKYFLLFQYRDIIFNLFQSMKTDLEVAKNLPPDEQAIIKEYAAKESGVCKQWLILSICSCGSFYFKVILLTLYNYMRDEDEVVHLHDLIYPTVIEERKDDNLFIYLVLSLSMAYYGVYSAIMYVAFAPLGPVFMLHAAAQLTLVRKRVDSLYLNEVDSRNIDDKLKDIIQHLQRIYEFVGRLSTCMTVFYEITLKVTSIVLPVTLFQIIKSFKSGNPSLEFTMFLFTSLVPSSSSCYYGDLLLEKGEEVRQAVYACGWEREYDRNTRSTLLLLLQRSSQPVIIRTMFRTVCLDALTDVFRQAYAIFNLINTVWE